MAPRKAFAIFDRQVHPLWDRFAEECRQFARGFNDEIGSHRLHVESSHDIVAVTFAAGGEVVVQLDRTQRQIACWMRSRCADFGSCIVEQPPVGLTIARGRLRFVYGASGIAEDDLAVRLLTDLIRLETPAAARTS
jgi:hypothetical protein